MKNETINRWAALLIVTILAAAAVSPSLTGAAKGTSTTANDKNTELAGSELIRGYKEWTRVNPVPHVFASQIAIQCAAPSFEQKKIEAANPHRDKYVAMAPVKKSRRTAGSRSVRPATR